MFSSLSKPSTIESLHLNVKIEIYLGNKEAMVDGMKAG